ncbi:hypothetical protein BD309DRAFT_1064447, partial [Dichomitus squalens]
MDGIGRNSKWLRGRKLPSIQDAAPRYGRPLRGSMDVPGAGLFVALGTSTAYAGSQRAPKYVMGAWRFSLLHCRWIRCCSVMWSMEVQLN